MHKAIHQLVDDGEKKVLLNLANITNIDSSGLGELVAGHATLEKNGGEMKLLNLTDRVAELMMITKPLTAFDVFEKEDLAVGQLRSGGSVGRGVRLLRNENPVVRMAGIPAHPERRCLDR